MRKILEGQGTEEGKPTLVHLLRALCGTGRTDEHGAETKTLRSLGPRVARDAEESVGRDCAPDVERNQTEKRKNMSSVPGLYCRSLTSCKCRRVRWYQSWARHPKDHHAVVTAVRGTCKAEEIVGVQRLTSEGNVCQTSTPMARQMADDVLKVSQLSEEVGAWCEQRTSDVAIFTPWRWERARFLEFPVEELRVGENGVLFHRVRGRANGRNRWEIGRAVKNPSSVMRKRKV